MRADVYERGPLWCDDCERLAEITANNILDPAAMKLERALNPENAAKFRAMNAETRRVIVCKAIEGGYFKWTISGRQSA
jgi:hypothetical protein